MNMHNSNLYLKEAKSYRKSHFLSEKPVNFKFVIVKFSCLNLCISLYKLQRENVLRIAGFIVIAKMSVRPYVGLKKFWCLYSCLSVCGAIALAEII